ncbi:VOC family protein [Pseudochelatococcus lubricantis]|uniref:VOC family protein n=1 Tax=Pseudochelatococcus lubricantis TaxID=1538102 RepID=UPI0035E702C2
MTSQHGAFIWYELLTTDVKAAGAFYGDVVGWSSRPFDAGNPDGYHLFSTGETEVGGLMVLPQGEECPPDAAPGWIGYIGVGDVDATASAIVADGGRQHVPPTDIPGVGRFAVVADPQGAVFTIMKGAMDGESRAFSPDRAGHCQWNELTTTDPEAAYAFYARHFGWTKGEAMPMGEAGVYQILDRDGISFGAVTPAGPEVPHPVWAFYFGVPDIDAAISRITAGGGALLHGPHAVPGEQFIVIGRDPQGAVFSLVGPRKA